MRKAVLVSIVVSVFAAAQTHHFERMQTPSGGYAICGNCGAPTDLKSTATIASKDEPGEPMEITGTVYRSDGKTPADGITIFVYHTAADGYYNHTGDVFQPRLYAYMKTGKDGRYEFRTIKPGRYPDRSEPAHIHIHVFGPDYAERFLPNYWFAGDPGLKPEDIAREKDKGEFSAIVKLTRGSDGMWHGVRNLRLP